MIGVDSNVLIDLFRNRLPSATITELSKDDRLCTSEIVVYEVLCGIYSAQHSGEQRLKDLAAVLDAFTFIFPIERATSIKAAQIAGKLSKTGQTVQHTDALIAGSLLANGCKKLLTKNVKDFKRIPEIEIISPLPD
ncbi:type II toxin-antitoxin system VapC family toxin [Candidatus Woesearchaeota archaeon]|nr:type II toxin-antitoxin system VapC family toxin [Candidatus Woesearchaeota archaeon]